MKTFDELSALGRDFVDAARARNFEKGLGRLLSDMYPDNAHFIYELLQNAEDAGAKQITFQLESERLVVEHNGSKAFDLADIESITNIGNSTKADEANSIGKFGVGFKAVFAYTSRPEIRSAEYSFAIEDLFGLVRIDGPAREGWTTFTFPFNQPDKPPVQASEEIARGLNDLGENTLLFLTSIQTLMYKLPDGSEGLLERKELGRDLVSIYHKTHGQVATSHWIRLLDECDVDDDDSGAVTVTVAAAFHLEQDEQESKAKGAGAKQGAMTEGTLSFRVKPLEKGQVSIYFPAVNATSGLRFHVHAPFASTPARDSVKMTPGSKKLLEAIGELIAGALPRLRDDGYLDDGLLAALPNYDDVLPQAYEVIRSSIFQAFKDEELAPTYGRVGFARTGDLLNSPPAFRRALNNTDLNFLANFDDREREPPWRWIAQPGGRAGKFLSSLEVADFGWEQLNRVIDEANPETWSFDEDEQRERQKKWLAWLEGKDDKALKHLYLLLGEGSLKSYLPRSVFDGLPLIRLYKKNKMRHVRGDETYLPSSRSDTAASRVPAALAVFPDDRQDVDEISLLTAFYERAGVKRWDESAKVRERLKVYEEGDAPDLSSKRHLDDLSMFATYVAADPSRGKEFQGVRFLAMGSTSFSAWVTPGQTYLDNPYIDSGLSALFDGSVNSVASQRRYRLWEGYDGEVEGMLAFCEAVGCQTSLRIGEAYPFGNPKFEWRWRDDRESHHSSSRDWDIEFIEEAIDTKNEALLRGLWGVVVSAKPKVLKAHYTRNNTAGRHEFPSKAEQKLSTLAWVLDRDGNLRTPKASNEAELADGLAMPANRALLRALEFGHDTILDEWNLKALQSQWASLGLKSAGAAQKCKSIMEEMTEDEQHKFLDEWTNQQRASAFAGDPSANPDQRAALAGIDGATADETRYETRERSVAIRSQGQIKRGKEYVRQHCSNGDGHVICQVCLQTMPFQVSGLDYFEAVEVIDRRKKDHKQNRLALCPVCAAKYRHARSTGNAELLKLISLESVDETTAMVKIPVTLAGENFSITFSAKHFIDLKAVLASAGEQR